MARGRRAPYVAVADGSRGWEVAFRRLIAHACHDAIATQVRDGHETAPTNLAAVQPSPMRADRERLIVDITVARLAIQATLMRISAPPAAAPRSGRAAAR
jgi:hypothetical protein